VAEGVFISVGSNLGDRKGNCLEALRLLEAGGLLIVRRSAFYETEPWGGVAQGPFVNIVVETNTSLGPAELLGLLKSIEKRMGRSPTVRWGPRIVDLDILLYGDIVMDTQDLTIPHPRLHERAFVLVPLMEIAPGLIHPVLGKSISELAAAAPGRVERIST